MDLKRPAASFIIAARFRSRQVREIAVQAVSSYREAMRKRAGTGVLEAWYSRITLEGVRDLVGENAGAEISMFASSGT